MKIEVGIYQKNQVSKSSGWKIVCEQEKIPHRITDKPNCPIIVCEGNAPEWLPEFMDGGGIGIITDCNPDTLPFDVNYIADASIEYIDLGELDSSVTRVMCVARIFDGKGLGKISLHENRKLKSGIVQDQFSVFIYQPYGKGGCWYSGLPLTRLLMVLGDTLRNGAAINDFTERIVSIDKHNIIRALRHMLIRSFNMRDLPYIHLWYYPEDYQSVFSFRVDVDGVFGENLIKISDAALSNNLTLTFFVNKNLCEGNEDKILKINRQHEIGNHADIHNLYTSYASNYKNVQNGRQWLEKIGVNTGPWFSAPRGMWNYQLHQVLDDLGYSYTSDFGCAIAGFPFYPYLYGKRSGTLQIPVNPFSTERAAIWMREKYQKEITPDFIVNSFSEIIKSNYSQNYPIILYSHPEKFGTMADYVFQHINAVLADLNVWRATITEFANWWSHRDQYTYGAEYDPKTKEVILTGDQDSQIQIKKVRII